MDTVKELTPRGTSRTLEYTMKEINKWYTGWSSYFAMTYYPAQLKRVEAHIRRRLRSRIIDQQKRDRNLYNKLIKRGVSRGLAGNTVYSNRARWSLSHTKAMELAYPNSWFINNQKQVIRSDKGLPHWFGVGKWIKLA